MKNKCRVIWLRPRYTQRPNFRFACRVLRFDASRRGHELRRPLREFSSWDAETHTFTLADEQGAIAHMTFLPRTIRWKLAKDRVQAVRADRALDR